MGRLPGASAQHFSNRGHNLSANTDVGLLGRLFLVISTITTVSILRWLNGRSFVSNWMIQNCQVHLKGHLKPQHTSIANIAKENISVSRVNGRRSSSSVRKTSGACQRAGPTTLVVVNVVLLKTGTNPKSTRHGFLLSSIRTLHFWVGNLFSINASDVLVESLRTARISAWTIGGFWWCRYSSPLAAPWS